MKPFLPLLLLFPALFCGAALDDASKAQQKAISELVQSLKSTKKVIVTGKRAGGKPGRKNPNVFKDKQKFILPKMPRGENPDAQLQAQIEEQRKLVEEMKKTPAADSAAQEKILNKQKEIQKKTERTAAGKALPKETAQNLKQAQTAMNESQKMLQSGQPSMAQSAAQKALSDLKQAEKKLAEASDRQMRNSLAGAQRRTDRLAGQNGRGAPSPQTASALRTLADKLLEDAVKQHKSGKQSHAEDLAELAKQIHGAASGKDAGTSLANIGDKIKALRMKGRNEQQVLAESAEALKALAQQLKYAAKHPETIDGDEKIQIRNDVLSEVETMELALDLLDQANGKSEASTRIAATAGRIRRRLSGLPESGSGTGELPPSAALELAKEIGTLCADAWQVLNRLKASESVYIFNPDDVPAKYRGDVAKYFELLSEAEQKKQVNQHE